MNKKRIIIIFLLLIFFVISFSNFVMIYRFSSDFGFFTGRASTAAGAILFGILPDFNFTIVEPQNASYDYNLSDYWIERNGLLEYPVPLNVTVTEGDIGKWYYTLYNLNHGVYYDNISFNPNTTISVQTGLNRLSVEALGVEGGSITKLVWFYVNITSSAPVINLSEGQIIYACENSPFTFYFNTTDYDDYDNLEVTMYPQNVFYLAYLGRIAPRIFSSKIHSYNYPLPRSRDISKSVASSHSELIEVNDGIYSDSRNINIQILKINNIPAVQTNLTTVTIYNDGDNSLFYYNWNATDYEDRNESNMDIIFGYANGSDFALFSPDDNGIFDFTADETTPLGTYSLRICVSDTPLTNPHENLSEECGVDGSSNFVCDYFSLTILDENQAPEIIDFSPSETELSVNALTNLLFNVSVYDPDENAIGIRWLLDDNLIQNTVLSYDSGLVYNNSVSFRFPCGVGGYHNLDVIVSDGILSDSMMWNLSVNYVSCPKTPPTGGGGGGGGGGLGTVFCFENWVCGDYFECVNLEESFTKGLIFTEDYYNFYDLCRQSDLNDLTCGYKSRECFDLNYCNNTEYRVPKPTTFSGICHYVVDPSCFDGIKNCHDDLCEVLIDCGGPCSPCPNCNDGILNQGEEGIDCGGPCLNPCEQEEPGKTMMMVVFYTLFIILLVLLIIYFGYKVLRILFGIWRRRKDEDQENKSFIFNRKSRKKRIKSLLDDVVKGD